VIDRAQEATPGDSVVEVRTRQWHSRRGVLSGGIKFFSTLPISLRGRLSLIHQTTLIGSIAASVSKTLTLRDIEEFIGSSVDIACMATDVLSEKEGTRLTQKEKLEIASSGETFRLAVVQAIQRVKKRSGRPQNQRRPRLVMCKGRLPE
jgi:hypothetical protein